MCGRYRLHRKEQTALRVEVPGGELFHLPGCWIDRRIPHQEDEYLLFGMAIKYAGLRGKQVRVVGNRSTFAEEEGIQSARALGV
jgi:hypothetical protein